MTTRSRPAAAAAAATVPRSMAVARASSESPVRADARISSRAGTVTRRRFSRRMRASKGGAGANPARISHFLKRELRSMTVRWRSRTLSTRIDPDGRHLIPDDSRTQRRLRGAPTARSGQSADQATRRAAETRPGPDVPRLTRRGFRLRARITRQWASRETATRPNPLCGAATYAPAAFEPARNFLTAATAGLSAGGPRSVGVRGNGRRSESLLDEHESPMDRHSGRPRLRRALNRAFVRRGESLRRLRRSSLGTKIRRRLSR